MRKPLLAIFLFFIFSAANAQGSDSLYSVPKYSVTVLGGIIKSDKVLFNPGIEFELRHGSMATWTLGGTFSRLTSGNESSQFYTITAGRRWYKDERFHVERWACVL